MTSRPVATLPTSIYTQVSIRALVNVHATTHPAAGLSRPSKVDEEPEAEPTEEDLHAALEAEERDDPEE
ncbi:MAG TPA: hypothetical protein ENI86_13580 [Acidimicrobiales bacterium]|nr:hypothetical protein [Acidimicrobiales bacterium]